jgi:hypothetical protein
MKNYSGDSLESHISFLYTSAAKPHLHMPSSLTDHKSIMTPRKSVDREERDEIEIGDFTFAYGGLEWDTGAVVRDAGSQSKSKRHGILKSLKKPFKMMKRKADQEPLVSEARYLSTENSTGWTTLKSSGKQDHGANASRHSDAQLL